MLNFRIIENPPQEYESKYEDFIRLYAAREIPVQEIREKLNWNTKTYNKALHKALNEGRITKRTRKNGSSGRRKQEKQIRGRRKRNLYPKYITRSSTGKLRITKIIKDEQGNDKVVTFGVYNNIDTAVKIRDDLIKCNWDKTQLNSIRGKYGVPATRTYQKG